MKTLTTLFVFALFSCGQGGKRADNRVIEDASPTVRSPSTSSTGIPKNQDKNSTSIYQRYIDPRLKVYLDKAYKGWTLPAPNRWDTVWLKQYQTDSTLINYVSGDFDCNGMKDYALILKKANGIIGAYAFLSSGNSFISLQLMTLGKDAGEKINIGLELLPPGEYNYIDPESEGDPPPIKIKCNSVQVVDFERTAETFYWEKGKLRSITTGD